MEFGENKRLYDSKKNIKYPVKDEKGKAKGNYYVHYARLHD